MKLSHISWLLIIGTLFCSCFLTGCGGSDGPELLQVTGKVTLDGQPVQSGVVTFLPDNSRQTSGPMATGLILEDGTYTVLSPGNRPGVIKGFHIVTVKCEEVLPSPDPDSEYQKQKAKGIEPCKIPSSYGSEKTSALTAEVNPEALVVDLDLKSKK